MKCVWRKSHTAWVKTAKVKKSRREYLQKWRKVKGKDLKRAPGYRELALRMGVDTTVITCPRQRDHLEQLATTTNMLKRTGSLDLNQSLGRCTYRGDGIVACIGAACSNIFAPGYGQKFSIEQLVALQGADPGEIDLGANSLADAYRLVGNAMSEPVVGVVVGVALAMVCPRKRMSHVCQEGP